MDFEENISKKILDELPLFVEKRKHYSKRCKKRTEKSAKLELSIVQAQLNIISHMKPPKHKSKLPSPPYDQQIEETNDFNKELLDLETQKQSLLKQQTNMEKIVTQIVNDRIYNDAKKPITTQRLLVAAKNRNPS